PHPEIFIKAAESIHVAPEEAIGFEDAQSGIHGLKAAGIYAVGISTDVLAGADLQVKDITELSIDALLKQ
ncbi:HAD-IA family hydrolase, partial [Enterococcus faecalis]